MFQKSVLGICLMSQNLVAVKIVKIAKMLVDTY
jgi:hypothetical protein